MIANAKAMIASQRMPPAIAKGAVLWARPPSHEARDPPVDCSPASQSLLPLFRRQYISFFLAQYDLDRSSSAARIAFIFWGLPMACNT
jgi:hypothetical protein